MATMVGRSPGSGQLQGVRTVMLSCSSRPVFVCLNYCCSSSRLFFDTQHTITTAAEEK